MKVSRVKLVGIALGLFALTTWLYWPCVHGGFLTGMDDDEYLRQAVRCNGLTWNAVKWAFTFTQPYWQPLPRLSHVLDYQIWGKNAAGHHATSVVVHALNAALVFGFLWTLLGRVSLTTGERFLMALGVSVVFAIHPLQTESVAWMSGRTQLLCATFGISCLWAYVVDARRWVVWALFVIALLCKPMAVSFPFVMLAIDYFPLRRHEQVGWGRLVREKAGLIGLGLAAAAVTMITELQKGGLMIPLDKIPLPLRVLLMFQSLVFYLWKLVWPSYLSPNYPMRLGLFTNHSPILVSLVSIAIITALAVRMQRRLPALAAGWWAYVVLVLPVSGLVQTGSSAVAMRYAYLAVLPPLLLAGGAAVWGWRRSTTAAHLALIGLLACELCVLGVRTRSLILVWHDDETLWRTVLVQFPDSAVANRLLLHLLLDQGRNREALECAQRNVEIAPTMAEPHSNLALVLVRLRRLRDAAGQYEQAVRIKPDYVEAHYDLGLVLEKLGRAPEAIEQFQQVLKLQPDFAAAREALMRLHVGQ